VNHQRIGHCSEDFAAVGEGYSILQIGEDFRDLDSGGGHKLIEQFRILVNISDDFQFAVFNVASG
jgi:hypothetical protein